MNRMLTFSSVHRFCVYRRRLDVTSLHVNFLEMSFKPEHPHRPINVNERG